jgi:hypothetical protein
VRAVRAVGGPAVESSSCGLLVLPGSGTRDARSQFGQTGHRPLWAGNRRGEESSMSPQAVGDCASWEPGPGAVATARAGLTTLGIQAAFARISRSRRLKTASGLGFSQLEGLDLQLLRGVRVPLRTNWLQTADKAPVHAKRGAETARFVKHLFGGRHRARTCDLRVANAALSQLS